jgi:hypothetical protein
MFISQTVFGNTPETRFTIPYMEMSKSWTILRNKLNLRHDLDLIKAGFIIKTAFRKSLDAPYQSEWIAGHPLLSIEQCNSLLESKPY